MRGAPIEARMRIEQAPNGHSLPKAVVGVMVRRDDRVERLEVQDRPARRLASTRLTWARVWRAVLRTPGAWRRSWAKPR
jgi:hypothetical protein